MDCPISSFWITGQMAKRKRTDIVKLQLRIREGLRGRLESAAKNQERSLNSEIVARLEESFRRSELASLTENVDRLSAVYEGARALLARVSSSPALGEWVIREREARQKARALPDQEPELPMPHESAGSRLLKEGKS
jgi:Arc-like DNA binding domain